MFKLPAADRVSRSGGEGQGRRRLLTVNAAAGITHLYCIHAVRGHILKDDLCGFSDITEPQ